MRIPERSVSPLFIRRNWHRWLTILERMLDSGEGTISFANATLGISPGTSIRESFWLSPIFLCGGGCVWFLFLIWLAQAILTDSDASLQANSNLQVVKTKKKKNPPPKGCIKKWNNLLVPRPLHFLKKVPQRLWNFYAESLLIPLYRPEWGKYQTWSYKMAEKTDRTEEQEEALREERRKMKIIKDMKKKPHPIPHNHLNCSRVKINCNGRVFETQLRTLNKFPETLLGDPFRRMKYQDPKSNMFFFDRSPQSFEAILHFYQSGGYLRRPENVDVDIFVDDAEFYGLPHSAVAKFKLDEGVRGHEEHDVPENLWKRKVWLLLEYPETSIQARFVGLFSVFVIVLSITLFCMETMPDFSGSKHNEDTYIINGVVVQDLFMPVSFQDCFFITETVCSAWFTFEYFMRLIVCPDKIEFLKNIQNLIDLIACAPYYIGVIIRKSEQNTSISLSIMRVVRLVRVFRIFKLSRHSRGLKILGLTLKASLGELCLLIFFVLIGMLLFSACLYYSEQGVEKTDFVSIPHCFWFTVITMTTVGYGDEYPRSFQGRVIGTLCAIAGVLTIALPVPVIVSNFNYYYHQFMDEEQVQNSKWNHVDDCPWRLADGDPMEEVKQKSAMLSEKDAGAGEGSQKED